MKEYKALAGQTLLYGLGTIVPRLLNYLLLTPFYTRIFTESEYGVISELYAYVAFLMVLLTYGMETTFFRFTSQKFNQKIVYNNALFSLLVTTAIFIGGVGLFKNHIADFIQYSSKPQYIVWFSFIVAFDAITSIPFAKLRLENKAKRFAFIKVGNILINIGFNIFFYVICKNSHNEWLSSLYKPEIGVGYAFISNLFASLFNVFALAPQFSQLKLNFNIKLYRKMVNYAMPLIIVGLAGMVNEVADKIFIKYLSADHLNAMKQVGIYGANYKLAILMTIFIQMFKYAAEPFFFKQAAEVDAKQKYAIVMNYFVIFCLLIFLLVTLYIDIFKYFIGPEFRVGLHIVPIILLANMFLGIYYNLSVWYKLTNKTHLGAVISIVGVLITIVMNVWLIPIIGYLGSALATFACYFVMMIISAIWGSFIYKVKYYYKKFFVYVFISIGIYGINGVINIQSGGKQFVLSTLLMMCFLFIVGYMEKISMSKIKGLFK